MLGPENRCLVSGFVIDGWFVKWRALLFQGVHLGSFIFFRFFAPALGFTISWFSFIVVLMGSTLLCNLRGGSRNVTLRLRLLHMWLAKTPSGSRIFNHCCLWADQTGMLIQSLSDPEMAADTESVLRVGAIYVISRFGLQSAKGLYRACSFDLTIRVTRSTGFQQCTLPAAGFPADSFEIVVYNQLHTRSGNHAILTDVVGRLHSIGGIGHQVTEGGTVAITLWDELTAVLDRIALIQADLIEPVIIAVGSLMVSLVNGNYVCSSSSATRVAVNPQIPKAVHLVTHFGGSRNPVAELPVEFATAEAAAADAANRARTIAELLDLHNAGASVESKYCCGGIVSSVESRTPWYYTACNMCLRKCFTWRGAGYWCPEHWEISEEHIRVGYKIQLTLRDMTGEAPFIIFGSCGNVLTHTTAQILAQRYPHRPGQLPPELGTLIGQYFKFEVKLPMVPVGGSSSGEYRMLRVFPNDNLEAQLPPPMMHALPPIVPAPPQVAAVVPAQSSHRPQVVQPSNQVTLNVSPGGMQLSPAGTYGASSSSSAKGKEKISSPVFQNVNPVFCIGQPVSEMPGQVIDQALPANPPSDNPDISHGNAAPVSQGLTLPLDQMVCSSYPENLQGVLKADATVVAEPLASASGPVVSANVPATSDLVVNEGPNMSIPSLAITSNDPPSTLAGSDVVSQSSSPMTKLLASPLA